MENSVTTVVCRRAFRLVRARARAKVRDDGYPTATNILARNVVRLELGLLWLGLGRIFKTLRRLCSQS